MKKIFLYNYEIFFIIFTKYFYYNWGIRTVIIYFCFMIIGLINDKKKNILIMFV